MANYYEPHETPRFFGIYPIYKACLQSIIRNEMRYGLSETVLRPEIIEQEEVQVDDT